MNTNIKRERKKEWKKLIDWKKWKVDIVCQSRFMWGQQKTEKKFVHTDSIFFSFRKRRIVQTTKRLMRLIKDKYVFLLGCLDNLILPRKIDLIFNSRNSFLVISWFQIVLVQFFPYFFCFGLWGLCFITSVVLYCSFQEKDVSLENGALFFAPLFSLKFREKFRA